MVTITHTPGASRIFGNRGVLTARRVSFGDRPITEAAPSTDMNLPRGVDRLLVGELNPGLPRDRRGYSPLYQRDCDRTNVESFSGCRVSVSMYDTYSHRETPASRLLSTLSSRLPSTLPSWLPRSPLSREPSSPLSREPSSPLSREPSLRERPTPSSRKRKRGYSGKSRQRRGAATSPAASVTDPDLGIVNAVSSNRCRVCVYGSTTERKTKASSRAFGLATANNGKCVVGRTFDAGYDANAVVSRCL